MCHYYLQQTRPGFRGTAAEPGTALQQRQTVSTAHSSLRGFPHHLQGPQSDDSALSGGKARVCPPSSAADDMQDGKTGPRAAQKMSTQDVQKGCLQRVASSDMLAVLCGVSCPAWGVTCCPSWRTKASLPHEFHHSRPVTPAAC